MYDHQPCGRNVYRRSDTNINTIGSSKSVFSAQALLVNECFSWEALMENLPDPFVTEGHKSSWQTV